MRKFLFVWLVLVVYAVMPAGAQEYSYTHYDIQDGLAGTTAYCIAQDADGLIWVGTETGVSRFDGTHFKNFTTADGLPDIEILQMFGDSHGRVWMAPFGNSICYYYRGTIHNSNNDPLLRKISLKGIIQGFAEDAAGNVLVVEMDGLHFVHPNGAVSSIDSILGRPIRQCAAVCRSASGHFLVQEGQQIWELSGDRFNFVRSVRFLDYNLSFLALSHGWLAFRERKTRTVVESLVSGKVFYQPLDSFHFRHNNYSITDDSLICFCESTGVTLLNLQDGSERRLLAGVQVSRAFRDRDGSLWFSSLDHGIYRLNSEEIRTIALPTQYGHSASVSCLLTTKHSLLVGTDRQLVLRLSLPDYRVAGKSPSGESKNKVAWIDTTGDDIICVRSAGVNRYSMNFRITGNFVMKSKWACRKSRDEIIIGSYWGCVVYNTRKNAVTDTVWRERVTSLYYFDSAIYLGTFQGLYRIDPDRSVTFLAKGIPFLNKRITSIAIAPDHTLWAASADDPGIIGVRNGSVVAVITQRQGLTSDVCRTLLIRDHILWVGTDKGLNAIRLDLPGYPVTRYTSGDGMGSDMINALYADSTMVYAGTPAGISFFNERSVRIGEPCRLLLLSAINSGNERIGDTANLSLSYRKANIRFEFAGISYRSAGSIRYRYRMLGLDSEWRETNQTFLDYPSLPSAKYVFQLRAINRFSIQSAVIGLPFVVETPFWQRVWFKAVGLAIFLCITWLFASWRIRQGRHQQEWRALQGQRMAKLEQTALQSQMNPHFIFNCLNSIQQFVFDNDLMATNEYITGFARLIRATLNYSSRSFISVAEEVEYLSDYLSLEKMRFENKMDYRISVEPDVDVRHSLLPPMMLQPYVENSVRHGLRHKTTGDGYIQIHFRKKGEIIVVTIRDNGIGRKKAKEYKTGEHIEYQSKGMSLTSARIQMIQVLHKSEIKVLVQDIENREGKPEGTQIEISFPEFKDAVREQL